MFHFIFDKIFLELYILEYKMRLASVIYFHYYFICKPKFIPQVIIGSIGTINIILWVKYWKKSLCLSRLRSQSTDYIVESFSAQWDFKIPDNNTFFLWLKVSFGIKNILVQLLEIFSNKYLFIYNLPFVYQI